MLRSLAFSYGAIMANNLLQRITRLAPAPASAFDEAAHLVRRTSLGIHPDRIERYATMSFEAAIEGVVHDGVQRSASAEPPPDDYEAETIGDWWLEQLIGPNGNLSDRMSWFWHSVLTTSAEKAGKILIIRQMELFRTHGLSNFRDLLQRFVVDGALLQYLDGDGSEAHNPNENLGRELMELFTVGRGNYTEDDVRVAARALAGWVVNRATVSFRPESAFNSPAIFRGRQDSWDTAMIVDALCDDPLTAINISGRLWDSLVGVPQTELEARSLGLWWHENGLDIAALVEKILRTEAFRSSRLARPKTGFEWWADVVTATGEGQDDLWSLWTLGQMPYYPPNVGGWADGPYWLMPGSLMSRAAHAFDGDSYGQIAGGPWTTTAILRRCGLDSVSATTRDVLDSAGQNTDLDTESLERLRWRLALISPEFNLS
jgi:uncharacterized protein (DUF1800 family)